MKRNIERRIVDARMEVRENADGTVGFRGYAAVFDSPAYGEVVRRSAFNRTLAQRDNVRFLVNHDGVPLASTRAGTMTLGTDNHGLWFDVPSADMANPTVQELVSAIRRGDLYQCSFAFVANDAPVVDGVRELRECTLYDVSGVTFPWYDDTEIGLTGDDARAANRVLVSLRSAPDEVSKEDRAAAVRALQRMAPPGKESWSDITGCVWDAIEETYGVWAYVYEIGDDWVVFRLYDQAEYEWGPLMQCEWSRDDAGTITLGTPFEVVVEFNPAPASSTEDDGGGTGDRSADPDADKTFTIAEARALLASRAA